RRPEFKADDSEATASPRPERAREQQHGRKAGDVRRRVWHGPATPTREGESWIAQTPMSRGGTAHSLGARLYTRRHRYVWNRVSSMPRPMDDAPRAHCRACVGHLRRASTFLWSATWDRLQVERPTVTECSQSPMGRAG